MTKKTGLAIVVMFAIVVASFSIWSYMNHLDYLDKTIHETSRWAVIKDSKGDIMALETTSDDIWNQLVDLHNKKEKWIGGIVEEYNNKWGFRFKPETIVIADVTIEGAQSNIQGISENLDYWINTWANVAFVMASVVELHE